MKYKKIMIEIILASLTTILSFTWLVHSVARWIVSIEPKQW